eukprot:4407877-Pyramimonas_sp.AAC.1
MCFNPLTFASSTAPSAKGGLASVPVQYWNSNLIISSLQCRFPTFFLTVGSYKVKTRNPSPVPVALPRRCPASPGDRTSRAPRGPSGRRPQGGRREEAASGLPIGSQIFRSIRQGPKSKPRHILISLVRIVTLVGLENPENPTMQADRALSQPTAEL